MHNSYPCRLNLTHPLPAATAGEPTAEPTPTTTSPASTDARPTGKPKRIGLLQFMERTVFDDFACADPKAKKLEIKSVNALFIGFGSVAAGLLSDLNSRLLTCKVFLSATVVMGLTTLVARSMGTFEVVWALLGFFSFGSYVAMYVRILERLPARWLLPVTLFCSGTLWTLSNALGIFLPFVFRDWTVVTYTLTLWLFAALLAYLVIPSKPLCRFCPEPYNDDDADDDDRSDEGDGVTDLFTRKRYLTRLLILGLNWAGFAFILYGFILGKRPLYPKDVYISMALSCLLYFVAQSLASVAAVRTRALMAPFSTFTTSIGVGFVAFAFFETRSTEAFIVTQIISMITSGAWTCLWLISAASFPRKFR